MPVPSGVVDFLAFPPVGTLNPVLDTNGPFGFGSHTFTTFHTTGAFGLPAGTYQVHGTYGCIIRVNGTIPATWGRTVGYDSGGAVGFEGIVFENRFAQVVLMHQLLSGFFATVLEEDAVHTAETFFWPFRLIGGDQLGLWVSPGITVDVYYLCIL